MCSIMQNNFDLFKNFLDIINNDQYLITCAKYYSSSMKDACTTCPADIVSPPEKVIWPTTFFLKKKMIFIWLLSGPLASQPGVQLMKCILIKTSRIFILSIHEYIYWY